MLPYACHLFCIAAGDLGWLKVNAPRVLFSFFKKKKGYKSSTTNLSVGGAGRSTLIGSHNAFSCFSSPSPFMWHSSSLTPLCKYFPHLIPPSFLHSSLSPLLCFSLPFSAFCFTHACMPTHIQEKLGIAYWAEREPRHFRLASVKYKDLLLTDTSTWRKENNSVIF